MSDDKTPQAPQDKPILTLIQQMKDGSVKPSTLNKEQRQQCVEALLLEGYSVSQIAQIVDRSEKTIKRDLADLRTRNAVVPSPELVKQLIGDLLMKAAAHQARLMRLARATEGAVSERAQAEYLAWRVAKETIELLQSLGYLPQQAQQVVGDVFHHVGADDAGSSLEAASQAILELEVVAKDVGTLTPKLAAEIQALQQRLAQERLREDAQRLLEQQRATESEETPHGS